MPGYLLDTDICVYWMRGNTSLCKRFEKAGLESLSISIISVAELFFGAYRSTKVDENLAQVDSFWGSLKVLPLHVNAMRIYGRIKAELQHAGSVIPDFDLLIASTALAYSLTLVTNNTRHYNCIPGLNLECWITS